MCRIKLEETSSKKTDNKTPPKNQNQINLFKLGNVRSSTLPDLPSQRLMYQTCEHSKSNWKTGVPGEKPLRAEKRTDNKLYPHESRNRTPHYFTKVPSCLRDNGINNIIFLFTGSDVMSDQSALHNIIFV